MAHRRRFGGSPPGPQRADCTCDSRTALRPKRQSAQGVVGCVVSAWKYERCAMTDNLTPQQRSYTMSRIRSTNTKPELVIRRLVHSQGLRFRVHQRSLPGCPDLVFPQSQVAVFIDGDFWHGWRFPQWRDKLAPYWSAKIQNNRRRDKCNFARLRRLGWVVLRLWEHQVEADPEACAEKVARTVRRRVAAG